MPGHEIQRPSFVKAAACRLKNPSISGTTADGTPSGEFCRFCFQNGAFTAPDLSMEGMIDKCVAIMAGQGIMPEPEARAMMTEIIPTLKRWQKPKDLPG